MEDKKHRKTLPHYVRYDCEKAGDIAMAGGCRKVLLLKLGWIVLTEIVNPIAPFLCQS